MIRNKMFRQTIHWTAGAAALGLALMVLAGCEFIADNVSFNGGGNSTGKPWQGATVYQLEYEEWRSNDIAQGGTQWLRFTARDSTQYIHASTPVYLNAQLYNSDGIASGNETYFKGTPDYIYRSVVVGQTYYLKIWPSSGGGKYGMTYSGNYTPPAL